MKKLVVLLFLAILWPISTLAATLDRREVEQIESDISSMYADFERGDIEPLLAKTHDSLFELVGGKEEFEKLTRTGIQAVLTSGVKFISSELGTPTQTYVAGDEEVCFVPKIAVMQIQGKRTKTTSFMIAIRKLGGDEWKYLDGSGLKKNPDMLYVLLPELERGIELPPNELEQL